MNKISVKCPTCGTDITVANEVVTVEAAVSVKFPAKKQNEAEAKIEALRNAGVNVSNLFSIKGANNTYSVGKLTDGEISVLPDDDPIFEAIRKGDTIPDRRLFRRWVMAQVFHMMTECDYRTGKPIGFTEALNRKGYRYQWEMVVEELRVQAKLYKKDPENFSERNRWFNKNVVVEMAEDYIRQLKKYVDNLRIRHCKGVEYVRIEGDDIFVSDLDKKIFRPLRQGVIMIKNATTPSNLYREVFKFHCLIKATYLSYGLKQSRAFKDAYKGAGAFYTLKNLILFHGCVFPGLNKQQSMCHLLSMAADQNLPEYRLFGVLKEFMEQNNIDIIAKQSEWRAKTIK